MLPVTQKKTSAAQVVILSINITQLERTGADALGGGILGSLIAIPEAVYAVHTAPQLL